MIPLTFSSGVPLGVAFFCALLATLFAVRLRQTTKDLELLTTLIRAFCRKQLFPAQITFFTSAAANAWQSFQAFSEHRRVAEQSREVFNEVIGLGARLVNATENSSQATLELIELLYRRVAPEIAGVAIVTKSNTGLLKVDHVRGLPEKRLREPLLTLFDSLVESDSRHGSLWGYHTPSHPKTMSFQGLGVGMYLLEPLENPSGIFGGIWIGFQRGACTLSPQRRAVVQALIRHTVVSLQAAQCMQERTQESKRERDFLLGLSHDLRSPGNTALAALRDFRSNSYSALPKKQQEQIDLIELSLTDQLTALGDILDYAKHKRGFLQAHINPTSLTTAIVQTVESYKHEAESKNLTLTVSPKELTDLHAHVDHQHLKRILNNLTSNAIRYTNSGSISISLLQTPTGAEIRVADEGIGIPHTQAHKLFHEFERPNQQPGDQGVGLGLALSKALAELNNIEVFYEPNKKGGSIFGLRFKLELLCTGSNLRKAKRALILDDEEYSRRMIVRYLTPIADRISPASTLGEAIALLEAELPELIVADWNLGLQNAEALLLYLERNKCQVPVIILTGATLNRSQMPKVSFPLSLLSKPASRDDLESEWRNFCQIQPLAIESNLLNSNAPEQDTPLAERWKLTAER